MPVVKVWCLPKLSQKKLEYLFVEIVRAVKKFPELNVKGERDMVVLFPTDAMKYGLGSEIIVEVTGLFVKPELTDGVRQRLAQALGITIKGLFPKAMVECFVYPFDPAQGFWMNPRMGRRHKPTKQEMEDLSKPVSLASPGWGEKT
jgi:hypothetical protein